MALASLDWLKNISLRQLANYKTGFKAEGGG
jgi:hypothetical protein